MSYLVKEIFYSIQGEGVQSGRPAVFCRFSGCNLWSGREEDRASAVCSFCDTDILCSDRDGPGRFESPKSLAGIILQCWPVDADATPSVVCTGGEPLLQLDEALVSELRSAGFEIAIETNGTLPLQVSVDWVCVSPKANAPLVLTSGDELKLVYPQQGLEPESLEHLGFRHFILQPLDGPNIEQNTKLALRYCLDHPRWRLGLQLHKILGVD